jgi:uncharacterized protein
MQFQCEQPEKNSIQSYETNAVLIDHQRYDQSLLVTQKQIILIPTLSAISEIHPDQCISLLNDHLEILLIGYTGSTQFMSPAQYVSFTKIGIGVECMKLDAACRTFNILLGEHRKVGLLLVFPSIT